jgi:hypothetical protein
MAVSDRTISGIRGWPKVSLTRTPVVMASAMLEAVTVVAVGGTVAGCPGSCEAVVGGDAAKLEADVGWAAAGRCCADDAACSACPGSRIGCWGASAMCGRSVGAGPALVDRGSLRKVAHPAASAVPTVATAAGAAFVVAL